MRYIALIDGASGAYGVVFPDLPGCTAMADTLDRAMTAAAAALGDWINTVESTRIGSAIAGASIRSLTAESMT
jgi:predicted RNase H-like HicB family nuclease